MRYQAGNKEEIISNLSKFTDALPILPKLKPISKNDSFTYYEVTMKENKQSLHSELDETIVWGYEGSYPGPTIEVETGEKVLIKWKNKLPKEHLFPIDYTVHGAHKNVPDVRTVVHLHGASVEAESDGYPEAWFTSDFQQIGPTFTKKVYRYDNYMQACTLCITTMLLVLRGLIFMQVWQVFIL